MEQEQLSIVLRETARGQKNALCDEWYGAWEDSASLDDLLEMFVRGQDFCIDNDYPTLDFIREHFDKEELAKRHIYLDYGGEVEGCSGTFIFLGHCDVRIRFERFQVASVYARHESAVGVEAHGGARVFLTLCEKSSGAANFGDGGKVKVYDRRKEER